jgi:Sugar phosphate permease
MSVAFERTPVEMPAPETGAWPWTLVWALSAAQLVSWGALYYSFSLFVVPMEAELGWSRNALNGALSLGLLTAGVSAFAVGTWIDRRGGRALMTFGSALGAAMLAAWSRVESLVAFYAIWMGLGLALAATLYEPAFTVLTRLFAKTLSDQDNGDDAGRRLRQHGVHSADPVPDRAVRLAHGAVAARADRGIRLRADSRVSSA